MSVSNPDYYCKSGLIEPFMYMKDKMTKEEYAGFLKGNIIRYVSRIGKKVVMHKEFQGHDSNTINACITSYEDACKIRKYADVLAKHYASCLRELDEKEPYNHIIDTYGESVDFADMTYTKSKEDANG